MAVGNRRPGNQISNKIIRHAKLQCPQSAAVVMAIDHGRSMNKSWPPFARLPDNASVGLLGTSIDNAVSLLHKVHNLFAVVGASVRRGRPRSALSLV